MLKLSGLKSFLVIGIVVALSLIAVREIGGLETFELLAFDQMLRLKTKSNPEINERFLIIEITEEDIKKQNQWPLPDRTIKEALKTLNSHKPVAIGLDLFRDLSNDPTHGDLIKEIKQNSVIPICKVRGLNSSGIAPPDGIEPENLGFADLIVDPGGIIRRGLIFTEPSEDSPCQAQLSLAFQLAKRYLEKQNLTPELTENSELKWGQTIFKRLTSNSGSYHNLDYQGYQIILNYDLVNSPPRLLSLDDLLNNRFEGDWIKDKIVLIGVTAPSIDDAFYTPYSGQTKVNQKMPGVLIHSQLTDQIINAVLGEKVLFWYPHQLTENLVIILIGLGGGLIVYFLNRPLTLILVFAGSLIILNYGAFFLFLQGGWFPVIPANLSLFASIMGGVIYYNHQIQKEKEEISIQIKQRDQDLILLRALIKNIPASQLETKITQPLTQPLTLPLEAITEPTHPLTAQIKPTAEITTEITPQNKKPHPRVNKLLVGRYHLLKVLGSGGFGHVYLAEDTQRPGKPQCVVKHLQPASEEAEFLEVARRLFLTEANILEKLGHHPQIPYLLAHFEENGQFYLVEEYIQGMVLTKELQEKQPFSELQVVNLLKEILYILSFIHQNGVIHRDLKPGNIIRRDRDQRLVLIDFGAVKEIQPSYQYGKDEHTIAIGTRGYTPVEQLGGQPYFNSDIYALGMIGIYALTGTSPDKLPRDEHNGEVEWHHLVKNQSNLLSILDKMVCYHFKDRYQSADLVLKDLKHQNL